MERPCAWKKYTPQQIEELEELCRGYKQFLSENKTERAGQFAESAAFIDEVTAGSGTANVFANDSCALFTAIPLLR